jgi:hypothetical protein
MSVCHAPSCLIVRHEGAESNPFSDPRGRAGPSLSKPVASWTSRGNPVASWIQGDTPVCVCGPALLLQEQTKAWLAVAQDLAVMVCVLLSDPTLPHAPAPLPALVATAFLGVLDMVRKKEGGGRKGWGGTQTRHEADDAAQLPPLTAPPLPLITRGRRFGWSRCCACTSSSGCASSSWRPTSGCGRQATGRIPTCKL